MEEIILRKLDEMFCDLREEIKQKHMLQVHQPKEHHQASCQSLRSNSTLNIDRRHSLPNPVVSSGRRVSMPSKLSSSSSSARRVSLPFNGEQRRSSLPALPARRVSVDSQPQCRESPASSSRKFSRDSIDLGLVIEDDSEGDGHSDYNNSTIVEEDEEAHVDDEVWRCGYFCCAYLHLSFFLLCENRFRHKDATKMLLHRHFLAPSLLSAFTTCVSH